MLKLLQYNAYYREGKWKAFTYRTFMWPTWVGWKEICVAALGMEAVIEWCKHDNSTTSDKWVIRAKAFCNHSWAHFLSVPDENCQATMVVVSKYRIKWEMYSRNFLQQRKTLILMLNNCIQTCNLIK